MHRTGGKQRIAGVGQRVLDKPPQADKKPGYEGWQNPDEPQDGKWNSGKDENINAYHHRPFAEDAKAVFRCPQPKTQHRDEKDVNERRDEQASIIQNSQPQSGLCVKPVFFGIALLTQITMVTQVQYR